MARQSIADAADGAGTEAASAAAEQTISRPALAHCSFSDVLDELQRLAILCAEVALKRQV